MKIPNPYTAELTNSSLNVFQEVTAKLHHNVIYKKLCDLKRCCLRRFSSTVTCKKDFELFLEETVGDRRLKEQNEIIAIYARQSVISLACRTCIISLLVSKEENFLSLDRRPVQVNITTIVRFCSSENARNAYAAATVKHG